jgi:hypothetical protein
MLQVFHAKWHSRLLKSECSEGCGVITEHRGSSFVPRRSEDRLDILLLKESLRQWVKEMRQRDEAMRQRDDFYASAFAQQQVILHICSLNYFIRYRTLSNTFKTNSTCATCIASDAAARNSNAAVPTSPTTTSLRVTS